MEGQPAQAKEPQHNAAPRSTNSNAQHSANSRQAGQAGGDTGHAAAAALYGGLAVWQVGNARGGGK